MCTCVHGQDKLNLHLRSIEVYTYIHTYTYIYIYTYTCIHTYIITYIHTYIHAYTIHICSKLTDMYTNQEKGRQERFPNAYKYIERPNSKDYFFIIIFFMAIFPRRAGLDRKHNVACINPLTGRFVWRIFSPYLQ